MISLNDVINQEKINCMKTDIRKSHETTDTQGLIYKTYPKLINKFEKNNVIYIFCFKYEMLYKIIIIINNIDI